MQTDEIDRVIAGLSDEQKEGLKPCSPKRHLLPKSLIHWRTKPGHRFPSPKLNSRGYAVRDRLKELEARDV